MRLLSLVQEYLKKHKYEGILTIDTRRTPVPLESIFQLRDQELKNALGVEIRGNCGRLKGN
jgi:hypothetical protein